MRAVGIVGASGSGKTTLIVGLLALLERRGIRVATVKHTHHDLALPDARPMTFTGLGAREVVLAGPRRTLQFGAPDIGTGDDLRLEAVLPHFAGCDLVLVEGFKSYDLPKIEVWRASLGKPPLHPGLDGTIAVAADRPPPGLRVPYLDLDNLEEIAAFVLNRPS